MEQDGENPRTIERYEALLREHLLFYDALRLRERRPRSAAQRQFQDVAWGKAAPVTDHARNSRPRAVGRVAERTCESTRARRSGRRREASSACA